MTDRLLLSISAALAAGNTALIAAVGSGVVLPDELLLGVAVVSGMFAAFVVNFVRTTPA